MPDPPDPNAPDVVNDFEAWAAVSARLIGKDAVEQRRILSELGLAPLWKNANDGWAKALASDIMDMHLDRAQRYGEICAGVMGGGAMSASAPDFRHRATFGDHEAPTRRSDSSLQQIGGTPFEEDPLDLEPTNRIDLKQHPNFVRSLTSDHGVAPPSDPHASRAGADPAPSHSARTDARAIDPAVAARAWPVEQYARYVAELDAAPLDADAVGKKFGLETARSRDHVWEGWDARLAGDPDLKARFETLLAEAKAELEKAGLSGTQG